MSESLEGRVKRAKKIEDVYGTAWACFRRDLYGSRCSGSSASALSLHGLLVCLVSLQLFSFSSSVEFSIIRIKVASKRAEMNLFGVFSVPDWIILITTLVVSAYL